MVDLPSEVWSLVFQHISDFEDLVSLVPCSHHLRFSYASDTSTILRAVTGNVFGQIALGPCTAFLSAHFKNPFAFEARNLKILRGVKEWTSQWMIEWIDNFENFFKKQFKHDSIPRAHVRPFTISEFKADPATIANFHTALFDLWHLQITGPSFVESLRFVQAFSILHLAGDMRGSFMLSYQRHIGSASFHIIWTSPDFIGRLQKSRILGEDISFLRANMKGSYGEDLNYKSLVHRVKRINSSKAEGTGLLAIREHAFGRFIHVQESWKCVIEKWAEEDEEAEVVL
ncbi:hypothetical protein DL96DRAFT_1582144 [Flagelloscypha sp. PMI_526]|nr:hypothetical protein DL96DRAFT_1582144 [Flagelloscypha sp. PMI_526]